MTAETVPEIKIVVIPAKSYEELQKTMKRKNVAAYCRVSTDQEEQESSYQAQITYYTDKINRTPEWRLAGIFADEGISGTQAKKRPEFLKMIRLCRKKKIDIVLTKSLSRFARNTLDCLKYIRELKSIGIAVIFEKKNINTLTTENEMLTTMMSCFAQAESESISQNVTFGIRQSFKSGKVPIRYGSLLGYKKGANDNPEIVPEEAETVKYIFNSYLEGASLGQIQKKLTELAVPTKKGDTNWQISTIKSILQNEKYTGDALLQKTFITDCITKKSKKNNGELPKYLVQNHHEAIISHEIFNRVQEEMTRRVSKRKVAEKLAKSEQGKYSAKFALTELLVCGECGTPYRRCTWTAKGYPERKWRCISRIQFGKKYCHNSPTVDEEMLQNAIVQAINDYCDVDGDVAKTLKESISEALDPSMNGSILAAKQRIDELSRNLDELIKIAATTSESAEALKDIEKFSDEMKGLRSFIETEKAKQSTAKQDTEQLQAVLKKLEEENFKLTEYNEIVTRQLLQCVKVIDEDTVSIIFKGGFTAKGIIKKEKAVRKK